MTQRWTRLIASVALLLAPALAARAAEPDRYRAYVDGPYGQIHVRVEGAAGRPTIVMLHKMVWSSVEFVNAQPYLARLGYRTISVDLPGYGLSDEPSREPTADEYAEAMVPVLDHFHLKTATILGADTGAVIAVALANRHPGRVDHLILEGVPLFDAATLADLMREKAQDRSPTNDGSEFARRVTGLRKSIPENALSNAALQAGALQFFSAGPNYLYGHHAIFSYPLTAGLKAVTVPTMVLSYPGKASIQALSTVKALRPDFRYVSLDYKGLMADFDQPEPWARAVADYLKATP